ncbi:MAG: PSD1 domain-containing protein [Planctomycetes bacterium]|nr:PSD1 domain-containing protein [Planctomycetota bacterium]
MLTLLASLLLTVPDDAEHFEKKIRPLLHATCLPCHGPEKTKAGLRLDSRAALLRGGDSGPSIKVGDPDASLLLKAIRQTDPDLAMPPKKAGKKLSDDQIRDFENWIRAGAVYPGASDASPANHWAFQPVVDPGAGIDALFPSKGPAADKRTLIRRVTYDLTGLPPSPEEVEAFLADASPGAFDTLVERLLASPAYGEKWGRKWLDLVRYADTAGENSDFPAPQAWRYRNWVIEAYNRDLPYDEFLREQLAGDLLEHPTKDQIIATGYLAVARRFGHDTDKDMHLTYEDVIDTLGKSVLGLTIGCARCHNHKYDPVTTRDYYALYGVFASTRFPFPGCEAKQKPRDLVPLPETKDVAYAVIDGKPEDARLQNRGEPTMPGDPVPRRNLELLGGQAISDAKGSGRLDLARWLTDPRNPLTARVMANRIWQGHFGRGLVATPSDFGTRGAAPTHPPLLDHLASRFTAGGWSVKALQRLILKSAAYQRADFPRRRLDAEEIRDALLVASGDLDRSPGEGHPFPPEKDWKFTQHAPFKAVYETKRRSVYLMTQRIQRHPFLALFDGPDANASTAQRDTSTVPTQALYFLNDPFFHARSEALANRLLLLPPGERVEAAHRVCFQRAASAGEHRNAAAFLDAYGAGPRAPSELAVWSAYARTLMGSNEFITVD